jgi:hypothetical protein
VNRQECAVNAQHIIRACCADRARGGCWPTWKRGMNANGGHAGEGGPRETPRRHGGGARARSGGVVASVHARTYPVRSHLPRAATSRTTNTGLRLSRNSHRHKYSAIRPKYTTDATTPTPLTGTKPPGVIGHPRITVTLKHAIAATARAPQAWAASSASRPPPRSPSRASRNIAAIEYLLTPALLGRLS